MQYMLDWVGLQCMQGAAGFRVDATHGGVGAGVALCHLLHAGC
jgi:hypothetical protein